MRTLLALAVSLSLCSFGMVGCKKETSEAKKTEMTKTPAGTTTTTTDMKTETDKK